MVQTCSSCRAGEIQDVPATVLVAGRLDRRPYKAWLCDDHYSMLLDDGYKLRIIKEAK